MNSGISCSPWSLRRNSVISGLPEPPKFPLNADVKIWAFAFVLLQSVSAWSQDLTELAPIVFLHPAETHFPTDPLQFIKESRFRHHRSGFFDNGDDGYNKVAKKWERSNSHGREFYNIPVAIINSYGLEDGKNRIPWHSYRTSGWTVFLEPRDNPVGDRTPEGNIPVFRHERRVTGIPKVDRVIQYWFFFGYNKAPALLNHQGDWEGVQVAMKGSKPVFYSLSHHGKNTRVAVKDMERVTDAQGRSRVAVYCAKGSHAFYRKAGSHLVFEFRDVKVYDVTGRGLKWDPALKIETLGDQPWKKYAGSWGEVGDPWWGTKTSGPLGPLLKPLEF